MFCSHVRTHTHTHTHAQITKAVEIDEKRELSIQLVKKKERKSLQGGEEKKNLQINPQPAQQHLSLKRTPHLFTTHYRMVYFRNSDAVFSCFSFSFCYPVAGRRDGSFYRDLLHLQDK